jgi:hypothetical protein
MQLAIKKLNKAFGHLRDDRAHNLLEKNVTPHSRAALSGLYSNRRGAEFVVEP